MANDLTSATVPAPGFLIPQDTVLQHWQGHRELTRRVIEAFPENELFGFSLGGMRPFAEMAHELLSMAGAGVQGLVTGTWPDLAHHFGAAPQSREELLRQWDEVTEQINTLWPQLAPQRWQEVDKAFGKWEGTMHSIFLYWVDNEVHHRGQGYVYLRALGIEPPPFWDRF